MKTCLFKTLVVCMMLAILSCLMLMPGHFKTFYGPHKKQFGSLKHDIYVDTTIPNNDVATVVSVEVSKGKELLPSHFVFSALNISNVYLTIYNRGKMGNQMFEYAALLCLTKNSSWEPYLISNRKRQFHRLLKTFNDTLSVHRVNYTIDNVLYLNEEVIPEADTTLQMLRELPTTRNITIEGYFQSYKFFRGCESEIRKEFSFPKKQLEYMSKYMKEIIPTEWTDNTFVQVGIHVRRSDMISIEKEEKGEVSPPPSYYKHAMEYFVTRFDNVQFIVATDDVDWCKDNIHHDHVIFPQKAATDEFLILISCDHIITSLGTFSWWAGWFNTGTTIFFDFKPPPASYVDHKYSNNSYFPPDDEFNHWVPII